MEEGTFKNLLIGIRQWVNGLLNEMSFVVSAHINELHEDVNSLKETKQDILEAGSGIVISGNVISSTGGGGGEIIEITHDELVELRDNGELVPGQQYRIIDYVCTSTLDGTEAMDNKYDIVQTAIDESTLDENVKVMHHTPEEPEHEVTEVTKFKFFSDMGEGGSMDILYGFMIRNKSIDGTNTSADERMADCQVGWSIIAEAFQGHHDKFDSASTFDDVTSWDPYVPDMIRIFTLNSGITPGETAYMDKSTFGDSGVIEFSILDTLEETHTEGGDYFKNCNLSAWELKYCIDKDGSRFNWMKDVEPTIDVFVGDRSCSFNRTESMDELASKIITPTIDGVTYILGRCPVEDKEVDGVMYYAYAENHNNTLNVIFSTNSGTPAVGDVFYEISSEEEPIPTQLFILTEEMLNIKTKAWYYEQYGILGFSTEQIEVGDVVILCELGGGSIIPVRYDGMVWSITAIHGLNVESKGVVYYMKDEWKNECNYDFKNIKFKRYPFISSPTEDLGYGERANTYNFLYASLNEIFNGRDSEEAEMYAQNFYTFSLKDLATGKWYDASVAASIGLPEGVDSKIICRDNKIFATSNVIIDPESESAEDAIKVKDGSQSLNNIVFFNVYEDISNVTATTDSALTCTCVENVIADGVMNGTFGVNSMNNRVESGIAFAIGNWSRYNNYTSANGLFKGNSVQAEAPISTNLFNEIWKGTQEEYDNMSYHNNNTLYIIVEEDS